MKPAPMIPTRIGRFSFSRICSSVSTIHMGSAPHVGAGEMSLAGLVRHCRRHPALQIPLDFHEGPESLVLLGYDGHRHRPAQAEMRIVKIGRASCRERV